MSSPPPPNSSRNWAERGLSSSPKLALLEIAERQIALGEAHKRVLRKLDICEDDEDDD